MEGLLFLLFAVLVAAVVGGIVWLSLHLRKLRRQELTAVAQQLGFRYYHGYFDFEEKYDYFELFQRGGSRHSYDLVAGRENDVDVMLFDYSYTTGSGKNRTTHRRSVCILEVPTDNRFPYVIIRPEGFFDKFASMVGFNDIDFESVEFSKEFFVKSTDRRFAYDLVHPRMMEYLLQIGSVSIELGNTTILVHHDERLSPREWPGIFNRGMGFFGRIPERLLSSD